MTRERAVGTNLVVGFLLGLAGFVAHAAHSRSTGTSSPRAAGAIPGAWLGAHKTGGLSEETLRRLIGVALVAIAVAFAIEAIAA